MRSLLFFLPILLVAVLVTLIPSYGVSADTAALSKDVQEQHLSNLLTRAQETNSDALVILKDGRVVGEWYFGKEKTPIRAMSVTKSVVSLAIGKLIDSGKISLDEPVFHLYPEWNRGRKKEITIRHLLNHTSGLDPDPGEYAWSRDMAGLAIKYPFDVIKNALASETVSRAGEKFAYNTNAANLLGGIVHVASGKTLDSYLQDELFTPLGLSSCSWKKDPDGNAFASGGLIINASDLAKIGQLMLQNGVWDGKPVVSPKWIAMSTEPGQQFRPECGLLWWIETDGATNRVDDAFLTKMRAAGASDQLVSALSSLKGQELAAPELETKLGLENYAALKLVSKEKSVDMHETKPGTPVGYSARGYLGQYLVVLPGSKTVAVRMISEASHKSVADDFYDFSDLVKELPP